MPRTEPPNRARGSVKRPAPQPISKILSPLNGFGFIFGNLSFDSTASLINFILIGFISCRDFIAPRGFHQSSLIFENLSTSWGSTVVFDVAYDDDDDDDGDAEAEVDGDDDDDADSERSGDVYVDVDGDVDVDVDGVDDETEAEEEGIVEGFGEDVDGISEMCEEESAGEGGGEVDVVL